MSTGSYQIPTDSCLHRGLKSSKIVHYGLRQLEQAAQQILGSEKLNAQFAGLQVDASGQILHPALTYISHRVNSDFAAGGETAGFIEFVGKADAALALAQRRIAAGYLLQPDYQLQTINEKRLARSKPAHPVKEPNGRATPDPENLFESGAINDRGRKVPKFLQTVEKLFSPFRFSGHGSRLAGSALFCHRCDIQALQSTYANA